MWALFHLRNIALKFFSLGCTWFSRNNVYKKGTQVGKTEWFIAYAPSRKQSKLRRENYETLLNIPEQNCMQNFEHFQQSSLLINIPNALLLLSPSNKRSQAFVMINRADPLLK